MDSRVLESDAIAGIQRIHHYDPTDDKFYIETQQDVTDVVESAKRANNLIDERARWGNVAHVARIPNTIFFQLQKQGIVDDPKAFARWLNDPDNRVFRTRPGKV